MRRAEFCTFYTLTSECGTVKQTNQPLARLCLKNLENKCQVAGSQSLLVIRIYVSAGFIFKPVLSKLFSF